MKTNINQITNRAKDEINKCLEGKSIFEMTVWVRDHAQYLKWFQNYNATKIEATMEPFMKIAFFLYENYKDDPTVLEDFKALCVVCVLELEHNCK